MLGIGHEGVQHWISRDGAQLYTEMTNLDAAREHVNVKLRSRDERVRTFEIRIHPNIGNPRRSRVSSDLRSGIGTKRHHPDVGFFVWFWIGMSGLGSPAPPTPLLWPIKARGFSEGGRKGPGQDMGGREQPRTFAPLCILCSLVHC